MTASLVKTVNPEPLDPVNRALVAVDARCALPDRPDLEDALDRLDLADLTDTLDSLDAALMEDPDRDHLDPQEMLEDLDSLDTLDSLADRDNRANDMSLSRDVPDPVDHRDRWDNLDNPVALSPDNVDHLDQPDKPDNRVGQETTDSRAARAWMEPREKMPLTVLARLALDKCKIPHHNHRAIVVTELERLSRRCEKFSVIALASTLNKRNVSI